MTHSNGKQQSDNGTFITASKILAILIGLIATIALIGWVFEIDTLKRLFPNFVSMKGNAAISFILAAFSILSLQEPVESSRYRKLFASICIAIIFLIGSLTLAEHLLSRDLHIDNIIINQHDDYNPVSEPGRAAPITAMMLILISISLAITDIQRLIILRQVLAIAIGFGGILILTAAGFHTHTEHQVIFYIYASIHTALNLILTSLSLLLMRPDQGIIRTLLCHATGKKILKIIPIMIFIPIILGYFRILGQSFDLYDAESGVAIFAIINSAFILTIILVVADKIIRADTIKETIANQIAEYSAELTDLYDNAPCGYHSLNADGVIIKINNTESAWFGYDKNEIVGKKRFAEFLTPTSIQAYNNLFPEFQKTGIVRNAEFTIIRTDGSLMSILLNSTALKDDDNNFIMSRTTCIDITEIKAMTDKLQQSNIDLQQFAYSVSHDLQAPLRTITSFSQLLAETNKDKLDKDSVEYIEFITGATHRMQSLINDLLEYSRVITKAEPFALTDCNLPFKLALDFIQSEITIRNAIITSDKLPTIKCDATQLFRVFQNLLSNAIKFCDKQPIININVKENPDEWIFSIKDNGIGIPASQFNQLFIPFRRLQPSSKYEGTGIGLATCIKVIDRHQGKIWAESQPGTGSTFYFTIPKNITQG